MFGEPNRVTGILVKRSVAWYGTFRKRTLKGTLVWKSTLVVTDTEVFNFRSGAGFGAAGSMGSCKRTQVCLFELPPLKVQG